MANRANKIEDATGTNQTLNEKEINYLFEALNLSTAADREKFLQLQDLSKEPNTGQDRDALRVRFRDSTVRESAVK